MEQALLLAQAVATAGLACWLTLGVRDNLLHPSLNETYTAEVMEMTRLRIAYPEVYAQLAHRAISNRRLQVFAFRAVICAELLATALLWGGLVALLFALVGLASAETARIAAICGATAFVAIWSAFLVAGNYFSYWFCHEGAQNTHFQMTLWGLATLVLLVQG